MFGRFYKWLTRIDSEDREVRRRGALFVQVCAVMCFSGLLIYPATVVHWGTPLFWVQIGLATLLELVIGCSACRSGARRAAAPPCSRALGE